MNSRVPSLESILTHFRACRGLYVLGAGASAGHVPFGQAFLRAPALAYLRSSAFSADRPRQSELTSRIVAETLNLDRNTLLSHLFPGRSFRPGSVDFPYRELLRHLPDLFARMHLQHTLSRPRYWRQQSDSYLVFRHFSRSMIMNYNLDGLATELCGQFHEVVPVHGTAEPGHGSPQVAKLLTSIGLYDLPVPPDDMLLCLPESYTDVELIRRLAGAVQRPRHFVAIIGYSFGRNGNARDDRVSWDFFCRALSGFPGNIYIVEPNPDQLRGELSEAIKSNDVFGIRAYWNVLAHAFMERFRDLPIRRSLNYVHEHILDTAGSGTLFPR
jgi:hypothetical protein